MIFRLRSDSRPIAFAVLVALALCGLLPLGSTLQFLLATAMAWAVAAVGLDVFSGYLGQPSFGHAGFVGLGAYGYAILGQQLAPLAAAAGSVLAVTAISAVIGSALIRLRDFGLVLGTFFLSYVVTSCLSGTTFASLTHAESGLQVPEIALGRTNLGQGGGYYWTCLALLAVAVYVSGNYTRASAGRALRLVNRSEAVADALGASPARIKLTAFCYSALLSGVTGILLAIGAGYIAPENFTAQQSIILYAMVAVGGMGSIVGPVLGAILFTVGPNYLQSAKTYQDVVFAVVLLACLVLFRRGIYGFIASAFGVAASHIGRRTQAPLHRAALTREELPQDEIGVRGAASLEVDALVVDYAGVRALDGVTFDVEAGRVHALVGPNGAGKTTLLNCVSGLEVAGHGAIRVAGRPAPNRGATRGRRMGVSRTFQNPALVSDLSCIENVMLGRYFSHRTSLASQLVGLGRRHEAADRAAAAAALRYVGIGSHRHNQDAGQVSFAELKLVDIARALAMQGRLLVIDEPTAGLSSNEMAAVSAVLTRLRGAVTMVVVSHHVAWVKEVAESATVLAAGKVIASGAPHDVFARDNVREIFMGDASPAREMEATR